jgi:hypothetical protein
MLVEREREREREMARKMKGEVAVFDLHAD